jgi:hypothetical protein
MRLRALIAAGLGALVVAGGVSGCGGSAVILGPLAQAADVTAKVGGAHMQVSAQVEAAGLPQALSMSGGGYFNFANHEGTFSFQLAGLPASAGGGSEATIQEILKGSDMYVGSSLFAGKLPDGAQWMKLDIAHLAQAAGLNPSQLIDGESNPAEFLTYLKQTGATLATVGSQRVRGVPTTHYTATIDLAKALAAEGADSGAAQKAITQLGVSELPVDVWVDSHDLVRRLQITVGAATVHMRMNLELFDFGATPAVSAPPASETFEATSSALSGLG